MACYKVNFFYLDSHQPSPAVNSANLLYLHYDGNLKKVKSNFILPKSDVGRSDHDVHKHRETFLIFTKLVFIFF